MKCDRTIPILLGVLAVLTGACGRGRSDDDDTGDGDADADADGDGDTDADGDADGPCFTTVDAYDCDPLCTRALDCGLAWDDRSDCLVDCEMETGSVNPEEEPCFSPADALCWMEWIEGDSCTVPDCYVLIY